MAWYDDERKLTHTETNSNAEVAANDAQQAAEAEVRELLGQWAAIGGENQG